MSTNPTRQTSYAERSIKTVVDENNIMRISNETLTPEVINDPDMISLNLKDVYDQYMNQLPRFLNDNFFVFLFHPVAQQFAVYRNKNKFEDILKVYKDEAYILADDCIYEREFESQKYYLGVIQPTTPKHIRNASVCIVSLCAGIEINGTGYLFKTREDVDRVRDFLAKRRNSL